MAKRPLRYAFSWPSSLILLAFPGHGQIVYLQTPGKTIMPLHSKVTPPDSSRQPGFPLLITGHSLGAGTAILCTVLLSRVDSLVGTATCSAASTKCWHGWMQGNFPLLCEGFALEWKSEDAMFCLCTATGGRSIVQQRLACSLATQQNAKTGRSAIP